MSGVRGADQALEAADRLDHPEVAAQMLVVNQRVVEVGLAICG